MIAIAVQHRDQKGTAPSRRIRSAGTIPAVFYGPKEASTAVTVSRVDFLKAWKAAGESTVIALKAPDGEKEALIHEVDVDPVSGDPRHVDFYVIEKGKKVQVAVPLEFVGVSPAIKEMGGTLVKVLHEIEIEAMPKDLPHGLTVDISSLVDFESQILIKDITLPAGVEVAENPEEVVALVEEYVEEAETPVEAPDLSTIEVEKKGKEAVEGEEGAATDAGK